MKRVIQFCIFAALLMLWGKAFSQGTTLTVIADNAEKFTMEVNGSTQNSTPHARVTATDLFGPTIKVKVFIDGVEVAPVSKTVFNKPATDFYYVLHKNAKGVYVLDAVSSDYTPKVKEETTATPPVKETKATAAEPKDTKAASKESGCTEPLTTEEFVGVYASVSARPFEPNKLSGAKNVVVEKCITVTELKELIYLLDYESSRLELAKYAYAHIFDPGNYSEVDDVFHSSSSVESLHSYINSKK
jgi:hypothetical protein